LRGGVADFKARQEEKKKLTDAEFTDKKKKQEKKQGFFQGGKEKRRATPVVCKGGEKNLRRKKRQQKNKEGRERNKSTNWRKGVITLKRNEKPGETGRVGWSKSRQDGRCGGGREGGRS